MTYEIVGLTQDQARQLADVLCGTAVFADGHAWISEVCVVRPQGCQCGHCRQLSYPVHPDPTGKTREPPHCPTCDCRAPDCCDHCGGLGKLDHDGPVCPTCMGSGQHPKTG